MNKILNDIISKIIFLPHEYHKGKDISIYDLLKKNGYFQVHSQVSIESICEELSKHPECIDKWIQYSEDKRCSSGYYLKEEEGNYIVGYYNEKTKKENIPVRYANRVKACARFIKYEIEEIRQV